MSYEKIDKHLAEGDAQRILQNRAMYQHGTTAQLPAFYRFVVVDVIFDPQIVNSDKINYWQHSLGVANIEWASVLPRNAIIGQRVYEGTTEPPIILFPFFPSHLAFPVKPGEHVWVMFEAPGLTENNIGYWFCRITEPGYVDDVNHTHAPRGMDPSFTPKIKNIYDGASGPKYEFRNGRPEEIDGERFVNPESSVIPGGDETIYERLMTESDSSRMMCYESVPRYRKRPGEYAFEGSNNALIVLGTDRSDGPVADTASNIDPKQGIIPAKFEGEFADSAGMIDIVVGRGQTDDTSGITVISHKADSTEFHTELGKSSEEVVPGEGNLSFKNDKARVRVAQRTNVDKNFNIDTFNEANFKISDPPNGASASVIKADKIRIIARSDVEILVTDHDINADGKMTSKESQDSFAAIVVRTNGDIIFRPSKTGYIKMGDDTADRALLCTDTPAIIADGAINPTTPSLTTTMGGSFGGTGIASQGTWAKKILVTGAK